MKNVFSSSVLLVLTIMGCRMTAPPDTEPGVSQNLANHRQQTIIAPRYKLRFTIPQEKSETVQGEANITFELKRRGNGVVLDFDEAPSRITSLSINGAKADGTFTQDHIILSPDLLRRGKNEVDLTFQAGNKALNRNDEFLYTLFVPDRASSAFPCFDQPNLKARFRLTLEIPESWTAIANGNLRTELKWKNRTILTFEQTSAIPTYLFSFVAGKFEVVTRERAGRTIRFLHRETDKARLERNQERLFDLHATALSWLEAYTGIPYPFGKFDFALIPSFQYNGMEHPGAILYRADALLLEKTPTQDQEVRRASLIAHETAHMWFGNLVTMDWFNDVWMKEVFANFMAAKIVHPFFPKLNHELRFLMAHYPAAYEVDRTAGANPIRQDLSNLKEAGSLYGAIIYKKAPIVMRMLETLIGEASFREGVQIYLKEFSFRNATWP
ncbi:MAG: M1 family aminopeptidase, partial [Planctomycetota bacterium]|nr:M1 family aminopeptidase [Planctomycetota bacterium]